MLLLASLLSCSSPPAPTASPAPDVLLILLDTFRADTVSPERTPAIHQHASQSWWPQSAWAPSPWTVPSLSALLTGQDPWVLTSPEDHGLPEEAESLPERLTTHTSAMFSTNPYVTQSRGFAQGFDDFHQLNSDAEAVEAAADWWSSTGEGPKLMVVLLMTAHLPYEPLQPPSSESTRVGSKFWDLDNWHSYTDPEDQQQIRQLYLAQLTDLDRHVAALLELSGETAITAVISDHGEELFEHGGFEHGHAFWKEVTAVHAAIRVPTVAPSRPSGLWTLQDIGQRLAYDASAVDQPTRPTPRDHVIHGYPLSYRDPVLHTWGIRTETDAYFTGVRPHQTLGGADLVQALESFLNARSPAPAPQRFESTERENAALEAIGYQSGSSISPLKGSQSRTD